VSEVYIEEQYPDFPIDYPVVKRMYGNQLVHWEDGGVLWKPHHDSRLVLGRPEWFPHAHKSVVTLSATHQGGILEVPIAFHEGHHNGRPKWRWKHFPGEWKNLVLAQNNFYLRFYKKRMWPLKPKFQFLMLIRRGSIRQGK